MVKTINPLLVDHFNLESNIEKKKSYLKSILLVQLYGKYFNGF